ncbi:MAG TPA: hypothetical protein VGO47_09635, partial [Chlamydiales bacterium]|nr:hypothetical protein [Chlamydiales bacterium]
IGTSVQYCLAKNKPFQYLSDKVRMYTELYKLQVKTSKPWSLSDKGDTESHNLQSLQEISLM